MARTVIDAQQIGPNQEEKMSLRRFSTPPQQEGHPDATEGRDIADYNQDVDYEGLEPKVEPVTQKQRKDNPDETYAKMELPRNKAFCQRMMPQETCMGILQVCKA